MESGKKRNNNKNQDELIDQRINKISKEIEEFKNVIKSKLEYKI